MAVSPTILTLNLGSQSLGLAEFQWRRDRLTLNRFQFREVLVDPTAEERRLDQITAALREMLAELNSKQIEINYAVANQLVFARFVKLPSVDPEKLERIIHFEVQQNVPFPINEVIWDYHLAEGEGDQHLQMVLVAIKSDVLEAINIAVEKAGVRTFLVDVATMALYNAFRYNYAEQNGCSLLVDIGARTTNFLFIESGKIFTRTVPIGGSSMSAAIAKEFHESLATAESRKKREGFLGLTGGCAEKISLDAIRVSNVVRTTLIRLHTDLARSISHYCAEQEGNHPERVFLAGGGAGAPHICEFFQEKMRVPVEFFNPLRNVVLANSIRAVEAAGSTHLLGGLVGLALRSAAKCPVELNLAPPQVEFARELTQRSPYLFLAAICLLFGLAGWTAYYIRAEQIEGHVLSTLQAKVNEMCSIEAEVEKTQREVAAFENEAMPFITAIRARDFWSRLLEDLNTRLPAQDIWITELVATSDGNQIDARDSDHGRKRWDQSTSSWDRRRGSGEALLDGIYIRGLYLFNPRQQEVVIDYFRNLLSSPYFKIDGNDQSRVIRPTTPNDLEWAFPYELRLELRIPLHLPCLP
jgi:type IV pilus assembly protein PilM